MTNTLSDRQRNYLAHFVAQFVSKTPTSQARRRESWPLMSDPRSSSGFSTSLPPPAYEFWVATKGLRYPIVGARCDGPCVWDIDGNRYVDFGLGFGVHFFGHRPPFVLDALRGQLEKGNPMGFQAELANDLAARLSSLTRSESVAFTNTGSEAVMMAVRIARAATGRTRIAVFEHSYHGSHDDVVASIGATFGIPARRREDTLVLKYGAAEALEAIAREASDLAAVLVEPVQARNPGLQPAEFLHKLRALTEKEGIVLVFDEVLLGFRIHQGGCQAHFDIRADLATYGKIIGGGMPVAVVAGARKYMDLIDGGRWSHDGPSLPTIEKVWFAGTFNKNPLALATTMAIVERLQSAGPSLQQSVNHRAAAIVGRLDEWLEREQMPVRIARFGSMFRFVCSPAMTILIQHLQMRGIYTWEGMVFFLSPAHSEADVLALEDGVKDSLVLMRREGYLE